MTVCCLYCGKHFGEYYLGIENYDSYNFCSEKCQVQWIKEVEERNNGKQSKEKNNIHGQQS